MTIRELIEALEAKAMVLGDDAVVTTFDDYTEAEGWDYEEDDLYLAVENVGVHTLSDGSKVVLIR